MKIIITQAIQAFVLPTALFMPPLTQSAFADSIVFSTNFDTGAAPQFSGVTSTEPVQGYAGIGPSTNQFNGLFLRNASPGTPTTLTLTGLPPHTSITLRFLFAAIDTWDGSFSAAGAPVPDYFNVTVDGTNIFSQTLCNYNPAGSQTYVPPPGILLTPKPYPELGFQLRPGSPPDFGEVAYDLGLDPAFQNLPHSNSTLTVSWFSSGAGWQGDADESWAIDNVYVLASLVPPTLTIASVGQNLAIQWPASFTHYVLESTASLSPPVDWSPVTNHVANAGTTFSATLSADSPARFFRLKYQQPQ